MFDGDKICSGSNPLSGRGGANRSEQIDLTRGMLLAARDRPVDECAGDPAVEWTADYLERRHHAGGLVDETAQLGKDRRSRVRLDLGAGAISAGPEEFRLAHFELQRG